jgi:hypothetical protein
MSETQATTTTEITIEYTAFGLERGTDAEQAEYELKSGMTTPDDVDDDLLADVYDESVTFEIETPDDTDTIGVLEAAYHGVEQGVADVDRSEYRSPMKGDVFVLDGTAYVVASIGFDELEIAPEAFDAE